VDPRVALDDVEKILDPTGNRTPTPLFRLHETVIVPVLKSVARKRLVETGID
jgi:hypothetical protein